MIDDDQEWRRRAVCKGAPLEWFFGSGDYEYRRAMRLCDRCPVRVECLDAAVLEEDDVPMRFITGVRGGTTPAQRVAMRRKENRER
jgi:WhiB family redox-sensing transcriptional regulator